MPHMNGIKCAMRVREAYPEVKIVGMSGGGALEAGSVLGALEALGAVGTIEKPLDVDVVLRVIGGALAAERGEGE